MAASRTVKTLFALLVAMTLGAFALKLLDSDPAITSANSPAALSTSSEESSRIVYDTLIPLRSWRNIVLHTSAHEASDIPERVHFVIELDSAGQVTVRRTDLWARQSEGNHIHVPGGDWNSDSIGIVVVGDVSRQNAAGVYATTQKLVAALQQTFEIPEARVYAHGQLSPRNRPCGVIPNP